MAPFRNADVAEAEPGRQRNVIDQREPERNRFADMERRREIRLRQQEIVRQREFRGRDRRTDSASSGDEQERRRRSSERNRDADIAGAERRRRMMAQRHEFMRLRQERQVLRDRIEAERNREAERERVSIEQRERMLAQRQRERQELLRRHEGRIRRANNDEADRQRLANNHEMGNVENAVAIGQMRYRVVERRAENEVADRMLHQMIYFNQQLYYNERRQLRNRLEAEQRKSENLKELVKRLQAENASLTERNDEMEAALIAIVEVLPPVAEEENPPAVDDSN